MDPISVHMKLPSFKAYDKHPASMIIEMDYLAFIRRAVASFEDGSLEWGWNRVKEHLDFSGAYDPKKRAYAPYGDQTLGDTSEELFDIGLNSIEIFVGLVEKILESFDLSKEGLEHLLGLVRRFSWYDQEMPIYRRASDIYKKIILSTGVGAPLIMDFCPAITSPNKLEKLEELEKMYSEVKKFGCITISTVHLLGFIFSSPHSPIAELEEKLKGVFTSSSDEDAVYISRLFEFVRPTHLNTTVLREIVRLRGYDPDDALWS